ncbi:nadh-cytochrome b5 reductase 1 [Cystoisospora suis]|uniref:NADH-cytochrome b5 reductase n=1 Tax=Cystoisospora suis TaxID=483139 RepID=A0A2C6KSS6_9APIC|nr:nadh-cytochrome b5 reductase 1 [Cystoisospora suis]
MEEMRGEVLPDWKASTTGPGFDTMTQPAVFIGVAVAALVTALFLILNRMRSLKMACSAKSVPPFLDKQRKQMQLVEKLRVSPNTHKFRFRLEHPGQILGLPVGKHLKVFAPAPKPSVQGQWNGVEDGEAQYPEIERKYTPVSGNELKGYVELVVKVYRRGEQKQFPDGGKMSQYLDSLKIGDNVDVMGPCGLIQYLGNGQFLFNRRTVRKKHVGMLAGGTGITPMFQLSCAILRNAGCDTTQVSLLFANRTEEDILLRDELEEMKEAYPDQFRVEFTVDTPSSTWRSYKGFIDTEMIRATMPPPSPDTVILLCGAPPMLASCRRNLLQLGYAKEDILEF